MHQPTDRVLGVLEYVIRKNEPVSLAELSSELCILKTTLLPILHTLCERRYLTKDPSGRYSAGASVYAIAGCVGRSFPLSEFVRGSLERLAQKTGETCYFAALREGNVLYLDKVDSPQPLRMLVPVGHTLPAYATALGKMLLAGKSPDELRTLYPGGLKPLTKNTVTSFETLISQLDKAYTDGYSSETEESMEHIRCFAVPVKKHGEIFAAMSVSIPIFRFDECVRDQIIADLKTEAANLSRVVSDTDAHL